MRVRVLDDVCQGHTLCAMAAPEIFKLREEDGHAYVESDEVPDDQQAAVRRAEIGCPERAIIVDD
jgi:ferredoxin